MGKFSLTNAVACKQPEKRPIDEEVSPYSQVRSGKMLKVSQVVIEEDGPKPGQKNPRKLSANAPIEISIRKYTEHRVPGSVLPYKKTYGLPVLHVKAIKPEIEYVHPRGAIGIVRFRQ